MRSEEKVAYMNTSENKRNKEAAHACSHLLHVRSSRPEVSPGMARAVVSSFGTLLISCTFWMLIS